jgi:hypothetical protein
MRVADRVLSVIIGLALAALGVLVCAEVIRTEALNRRGHLLLPFQSVSRYLHRTAWNSTAILAISAAVAAAGLLLVALELKRRRPGLLVMAGGRDDLVASTSPRSVARTLSRAAEAVPGVFSAKARVRRRRASVRARTRLREGDDLEQRVRERLERSVADLDLLRAPRLRLRLVTGKDGE